MRRPAPGVLAVSQACTGAALRPVIRAAVVGAFVLVPAPPAAGDARGGARASGAEIASLTVVPLAIAGAGTVRLLRRG